MGKGKKAVSTLIATVLIIGITIAAFGLIYTFIIPLVREGISVSQLCSDAQINIVNEKGYTCFRDSSDLTNPTTLDVQVMRGPKNTTSLSGIQIIYSESGNSYIETIDLTQAGNELRPNAEKVYGLIDYTPSGFTNIDLVSVAAVINLGNKEQACNPSPEANIDPCI